MTLWYSTLVHSLWRGSYLYSRLQAASPPLSLEELPPAAKIKPPSTAREWWLRLAGSSVSTSQLPVSLSSRQTLALSSSPRSDTSQGKERRLEESNEMSVLLSFKGY